MHFLGYLLKLHAPLKIWRTLSYGTMAGMILTAFGSLIRNVFQQDLTKSPREQETMVLALEFGYLPGEVMASHRTEMQKNTWGNFGLFWGGFFLTKLFFDVFSPNSCQCYEVIRRGDPGADWSQVLGCRRVPVRYWKVYRGVPEVILKALLRFFEGSRGFWRFTGFWRAQGRFRRFRKIASSWKVPEVPKV